jgi:hypothetical protein
VILDAELLGLTGPLGDQTAGPIGGVPTGEPVGVVL